MAAQALPPKPSAKPTRPGEATAPQPRGEHELDLDTEWDQDWPADDDGDWSGCVQDGQEDGE